ncbi:MAG: heavy-metal-associated domain-containing protein [Bacteroidales bacterium]
MKAFRAIKSLLLKNKKLLIALIVLKWVVTISIFGFAQSGTSGKDNIRIKSSVVCNMCKERVESGLAFEKGIKDVSVDLDSKIITVTYKSKKTSPEKIRLAISKLGYDADEVPADQKAHDKLPACCKKGNERH